MSGKGKFHAVQRAGFVRSSTSKARFSVSIALVLVLLALSGCSNTNEATNPASDIGVSETAIRIGVGVSDLDGLRAAGIALAPTLTTGNLSKRVTAQFEKWNQAGGINGRQIEPVILTWDPTKPATQDRFCADATIDNQLFAVIAVNGLNSKTVQCVVDAGVPLFFGEVPTDASLATGLLISIAPSTESIARIGTEAALASGSIAPDAVIGILAGNDLSGTTGSSVAKQALESAGHKTVVVSVNTQQGDVGAINAESALASNTFKGSSVSHVMVLLGVVSASGFWASSAGQGFTFTVLDTASANCTAFGASRAPAAAAGATCMTTFGDSVTPAGSIRQDNSFETECRIQFDETFAGDFPTKSSPGVPAGDTIKLADGTILSSDAPFDTCTLLNVMKLGLEKSGESPTRPKFMDAVSLLGDVPVGLASNGKGSITPDKHSIADSIHSVILTLANLQTVQSTSGTFNGCPVPRSCWIPASDTWFPVDR